jgi:subtilisin family serine protease
MKDDAFLFPFDREDIFGASSSDPQSLGWEITKLGVDEQWSKSQGEGVTVAVIDTGCDATHPDIRDNIVEQYNFINKTQGAMDDNGHGSHVSGTIAAINNGVGMVGVAPRAKIMSLKALNAQGNGRMSDIVDAVLYAANNGADIITMSLGSKACPRSMQEAIRHAESRNCLIFCAAGNSGPKVDILCPAKDEKTIAIGAIDINFNRTGFTCSGPRLDFLAPGSNIRSIVPHNKYALMSGTSMSNPFAAGCAALYLSYYRYKKNQKYISREEMINIFKKNTLMLKNTSQRSKKMQGYGIIKPVL